MLFVRKSKIFLHVSKWWIVRNLHFLQPTLFFIFTSVFGRIESPMPKALNKRSCNMMKQQKIVFLHGFFASGQCVPAQALQEAFADRAQVISPDLPRHPKEALELIQEIIDREQPDLLLGNSCGAFYAQMVAPVVDLPALLGNPHFQMTDFLKQRVGEHEYKSPRRDGNQHFVIDEALIEEFAALEPIQFDNCTPRHKERIWGLFGEQDKVAHFEPLFLEHYSHSFHFPGAHTPTREEVIAWYVPLAEELMSRYR